MLCDSSSLAKGRKASSNFMGQSFKSPHHLLVEMHQLSEVSSLNETSACAAVRSAKRQVHGGDPHQLDQASRRWQRVDGSAQPTAAHACWASPLRQLELPIGECKDHACSSCFGTLAATPPSPSGYTTPSDDRLRSPGIVTFNLLYHDLVSLGHCAFFSHLSYALTSALVRI